MNVTQILMRDKLMDFVRFHRCDGGGSMHLWNVSLLNQTTRRYIFTHGYSPFLITSLCTFLMDCIRCSQPSKTWGHTYSFITCRLPCTNENWLKLHRNVLKMQGKLFPILLNYSFKQICWFVIFINYSSSFPFVPLQRRGCLVAPLFLWIVLVPCAGD
jgi:hypothetical protein